MQECTDRYLARRRYLAAMPETALSERLVHLVNNCVRLDAHSMVQLRATEDPDMFMRLLDVLAEIGIRHGGIQTQSKEPWDHTRNAMIRPGAAIAEKAQRLAAQIPRSDALLFRFSKYEHMKELVDDGGMLLQQASTFKDEENISVRDDELRLQFDRYVTPEEAATLDDIGESMLRLGSNRLAFSLQCPDFLTLCMTDSVNYRMISDWRAEAAVVIHDPIEFQRRLANGTRHLASHGDTQHLEHGKLHYIDPYFPLTSKDVPFCKHFRFAYQREFRFVIRKTEATEDNARKIFLGPLTDIATLVDLR